MSDLPSLTKSVSADGTTIYISVHRWSKHDKVPCLGHKPGIRTHNATKCKAQREVRHAAAVLYSPGLKVAYGLSSLKSHYFTLQ